MPFHQSYDCHSWLRQNYYFDGWFCHSCNLVQFSVKVITLISELVLTRHMFVRKVCLSYNNIQQSMRKFFMPFLGTAHNHPNFFILFWSTPASSSELCTNSDRLLTIISNLYYSISIGYKIPQTLTKNPITNKIFNKWNHWRYSASIHDPKLYASAHQNHARTYTSH